MKNNWFVWTEENQFEFYPTQALAVDAAKALIPNYLVDGEWDENVTEIKVGYFSHQIVECDRVERPAELDTDNCDIQGNSWGDFDYRCNYKLEDSNTPDPETRIQKAGELLAFFTANRLEAQAKWEIMTPLERKRSEIEAAEFSRSIDRHAIPYHRLAHGIDRNGKPFEYDAIDVFYDLEEFNYRRNQVRYFNECLDLFPDELVGKYILFESGRIVDTDTSALQLIERIKESKFAKQRPAIFVEYLPPRSERQPLPIPDYLECRKDLAQQWFDRFKELDIYSRDYIFRAICNDRLKYCKSGND